MTTASDQTSGPVSAVRLSPLPPFSPDLYQRAWASVPHPTLPLLATTHAKAVTVFSLSTMTKHSALTGGHSRSVRCAAWKPSLPPQRLCLVTGSFDATAGLWRWDREVPLPEEGEGAGGSPSAGGMEVEVAARRGDKKGGGEEEEEEDWEFTLVLEGHENEIKSVAFSPSGQYLATCSRDKTVWIWEDVGATEADDEWETVAVLSEHDGDVKAVAWCPDVPGRNRRRGFGAEVLASASYDNTVRVWREDSDGEWVCVAVLDGHGGTVWGLQWEPRPEGQRFPRLLTCAADATIRVWTLREEEEEEDNAAGAGAGGNDPFRGGLGGIPNTMRSSIREEWDCTAVLPKVHTRDIYSVAWSAGSGLVASTGSDGMIVVYGEAEASHGADGAGADGAGATGTAATGSETRGLPSETGGAQASSGGWRILEKVDNGHGPYEINHVTWCKRFDCGSERRGVEEMLVTSGDDGVIRPWQVET